MEKKGLFIIGVIIIALVIVLALLITGRPEPEPTVVFVTLEDARETAFNWMENEAPTYTFDGFDLELVGEDVVEEGRTYEFLFSFTSQAAGFGDREGEMLAQVLTPHETLVRVDGGVVTKAITDGVFDELTQTMIEEEPEDETISLTLYFGRLGEEEELFPVERVIPYTQEVAFASMTELIAGPAPEEKDAGYFSAINATTEVNSIDIENGVAFVDFSAELEEGVAGSATVDMIRKQIETTLLEYPTIDSVVISIEGRTEDILQP